MAYLGSHTTTPITAEFPCNGYGDILLVESEERGNKISEPVVQHNLAAFWRRPGLSPVSAGFPVPLMHTASLTSKNSCSRTPGAWPISSRKISTFRRNLIASELIESSESGIRLFVVNELSDRKTLIQSEFSFSNPYCGRRKYLKLSTPENSCTFDLSDEALELRTFQDDVTEKRVFVRTKKTLDLCNTETGNVDKCFGMPVCDFFQTPYLEEDLVIIDSFQHIWHGTVGANFNRRKVDFSIQAAAPTDCPKTIIVSDGREIRFVDFRESRRHSTDLLFKLEDPAFFNAGQSEYMQIMTELHQNQPEEIFHLTSLPDRPFASIASSSRHHFLLDHRVPGVAIVTMNHSMMHGGDYVFIPPPMKDSLRTGYVYNYFSLNQYHTPQTAYWPFYINTRSSIWSSVGPIKMLPMPEILEQYYLSKPRLFPHNFTTKELPTITRSVCYQSLPSTQNLDETRALIFRQMDSGDIWYDNFIMDPSSNEPIDQTKYRLKTFRMIENYFGFADDADCFRVRLTGENEADDDAPQDPHSKLKCYKILPDLEDVPSLKSLSIDLNPFDEIGRSLANPPLIAEELEIQEKVPDDHIFSAIILKSWTKSDRAFMNYLDGTLENDLEEIDETSDGIQETSQPTSQLFQPAPVQLEPFEDEEDFNFDEMDFHSD